MRVVRSHLLEHNVSPGEPAPVGDCRCRPDFYDSTFSWKRAIRGLVFPTVGKSDRTCYAISGKQFPPKIFPKISLATCNDILGEFLTQKSKIFS